MLGLGSRLANRLSVRLALYAVLALVLVYTSLPSAASDNEFRDAQVMLGYERAAVDTVRHYGQIPMWDPWYCGGLDGVGAPQSRFVSPTLLLSIWFGAERAELLIVFLLTILGMEGTFRWLRTRVEDPAAAFVIAPLFALSGQFSVSYFRGWTSFFGFELVPWILLGITLAARGHLRGVAIAAVSFTLMLGFGGSFAAPLIAVAAIVEAIRAFSEEAPTRRPRALLMLIVTAGFMVTTAMVRMWPIAETLAAAPRIMAGTPGHLPKALLSAITTPVVTKDGDIFLPGSFYVGTISLALVALGVSDRKSLRGFLAVVVFVWFASGYLRKPSLFGLLRELPVFSALRYPERFLWLAILFACEPAARGLARIPLLGEGKTWRRGTWIAFLAAVGFVISGEIQAFHRIAKDRSLGTITSDAREEFHQSRGNRWLVAHYEALNVGSLSCWETHPVVQTPLLRADLPNEEYLADEDAGTAKRVSWSPNLIVVHVSLTKPARLLVNQNWHPGWHADSGNVISNEGLLAVDLPAGERDVRIRYRPWSTIGGALVTFTSLAMLGVLGWRTRRRGELWSKRTRIVTIACVLAPWAVLGAAYAGSPDPHFPPPTLRNPDGTEAVVADETKLDATKIGASLDIPIVVEAGMLRGPDQLGNLVIDTYLRRTGKIPRSETMFVHVERRKGEKSPKKDKDKKDLSSFFNADHQVLAGTFYLSDAPEGRLVHDARGVHIKDAEPGVWDVWVAFGHVAGNQGRAHVTSPGAGTVSDDRIRIGTFVVP